MSYEEQRCACNGMHACNRHYAERRKQFEETMKRQGHENTCPCCSGRIGMSSLPRPCAPESLGSISIGLDENPCANIHKHCGNGFEMVSIKPPRSSQTPTAQPLPFLRPRLKISQQEFHFMLKCRICGKPLETNLSPCDHGRSIPEPSASYYATTPPALRPIKVGPGVPAPDPEEFGLPGVLRERRIARELGRDE